MRRLALLALISALLGVVCSQAFALLCVYRAKNSPVGAIALDSAARRLPEFLRSAWPEPTEGTRQAGLLLGHTSVMLRSPVGAPPDFRELPPMYGVYVDTFGWPARSVVICRACVLTTGANGGAVDMRAFFDDFGRRAGLAQGIPAPAWLPASERCGQLVPVWPIWGGLGLNAMVYGLAGFGLFLLPRRLRRMRRARRGRCLDCGYELTGLDRCPECGAMKPRPAGLGGPVVSKGPGA